MELHDNHIWIYSRILQVSRSLNRDNHGIFISLILFENMTPVSNLQFFSLWEPLLPSPQCPRVILNWYLYFCLRGPRGLCQKERKNETKTKTRPSPYTHLPWRAASAPSFLDAGPEQHSRKIAACNLLLFESPTMLSCLQVNLSWGICHGSSRFCI